VLGQQGLITEAGYNEQAASYKNMSEAATAAGNAENQASTFAEITAGIKGIAAIADVFTGLPVSSVVSGFIPQAPERLKQSASDQSICRRRTYFQQSAWRIVLMCEKSTSREAVTPEMMAAGAEVIYWSGNVDVCAQDWVLRRLAREVFLAMKDRELGVQPNSETCGPLVDRNVSVRP